MANGKAEVFMVPLLGQRLELIEFSFTPGARAAIIEALGISASDPATIEFFNEVENLLGGYKHLKNLEKLDRSPKVTLDRLKELLRAVSKLSALLSNLPPDLDRYLDIGYQIFTSADGVATRYPAMPTPQRIELNERLALLKSILESVT